MYYVHVHLIRQRRIKVHRRGEGSNCSIPFKLELCASWIPRKEFVYYYRNTAFFEYS